MKFNNIQNKCITGIDNVEYWISRSTAVVGTIVFMVKDTPYFLITKRGSGAADEHGKWVLPSGYLDWQESGYQAFKRETYEETGILLINEIDFISDEEFPSIMTDKTVLFISKGKTSKDPWKVVTEPSKDPKQNIVLHYYYIVERRSFFSEPPIPKILDHNEVSDVKWVSIYEFDAYEYAFNHNETIKEFIKKFNLLNNI